MRPALSATSDPALHRQPVRLLTGPGLTAASGLLAISAVAASPGWLSLVAVLAVVAVAALAGARLLRARRSGRPSPKRDGGAAASATWTPAVAHDAGSPGASLRRHVLVALAAVGERASVQMLLSSEGYQVLTAGTTAGALETLAGQRVDLVVADRALPDGGADVLVQVLAETCNHVPVIVLDDQDRPTPPPGIRAVVARPVERARLLDAVGRALACTGLAGYLDEDVLVQLARDLGPEDLPRFMAGFLAEAAHKAARITQAGSSAEIEREAHSLKSSAGTFGAFRLAVQAAAIERACRTGRVAEARALARDLPELVRLTAEALRQRDSESGSRPDATDKEAQG